MEQMSYDRVKIMESVKTEDMLESLYLQVNAKMYID